MTSTDRERFAAPRAGRALDRAQSGAIARGLMWAVLGVFVAVAAFVLSAPELVRAEPGQALQPIAIVLLAAVPGLILLVIAAVRRHRLGLDEPDPPVHPARRRALERDDADPDGRG
jgi:hypothetical protein